MSGNVNSKKRRKRKLRELNAVVDAVNDYLGTQNGEGFKERPRAAEARIRLCRAVYVVNARRERAAP